MSTKLLSLIICCVILTSCVHKAEKYAGENREELGYTKIDIAEVADAAAANDVTTLKQKSADLRVQGEELKKSGIQIQKEAERNFFSRLFSDVVDFVKSNGSKILTMAGQAITGNWGGLVTTAASLGWVFLERSKKKYFAEAVNDVAFLKDDDEIKTKLKEIFKRKKKR